MHLNRGGRLVSVPVNPHAIPALTGNVGFENNLCSSAHLLTFCKTAERDFLPRVITFTRPVASQPTLLAIVASYRHIRNTHRIVVSREKPADWLLSQVLADLYGLDLPATDLPLRVEMPIFTPFSLKMLTAEK
jgi:hypothetical protein